VRRKSVNTEILLGSRRGDRGKTIHLTEVVVELNVADITEILIKNTSYLQLIGNMTQKCVYFMRSALFEQNTILRDVSCFPGLPYLRIIFYK
jgi:hypothetical protein